MDVIEEQSSVPGHSGIYGDQMRFPALFPFYKNLWSQKTPSDPDRTGIFFPAVFPRTTSLFTFRCRERTDKQTEMPFNLRPTITALAVFPFLFFLSFLSDAQLTESVETITRSMVGDGGVCVFSVPCLSPLREERDRAKWTLTLPWIRTLRDGRERTSKGKERDSGHVRLLSPPPECRCRMDTKGLMGSV